MQKEDLLKRMRVWTTVITSAFAVVIVALVFQFAIIANNNRLQAELAEDNASLSQQIADREQDKAYYENGGGSEYARDELGKQ